MGCQLDRERSLSSSILLADDDVVQGSGSFGASHDVEGEVCTFLVTVADSPIRKVQWQYTSIPFTEDEVPKQALECSPEDAGSNLSTDRGSDSPRFDDAEIGSDRDSVASVTPPAALLIYDWDDTLFPTSWAQKRDLLGAETPTEEQKGMLDAIAQGVQDILAMSQRLGKVVIVTNADDGWIEQCCERLMPSLCDVLSEVDVISARGRYETDEVKCPFEWKRLCFTREISLAHGGPSNDINVPRLVHNANVVCVGDSLYEHSAMASVAQGLLNCSAKSLKFCQFPTVEELAAQQGRLMDCLERIVNHPSDLYENV